MTDLNRNITLGDKSVFFEKAENAYINYGEKKIKKLMGAVPVNPEIFIGRDNDITEINKKLCENDNCLLLVNGEGGIGKTTVASAYYHKYLEYYSHLAWIAVEKNIQDALLSLSLELQLHLDDIETTDKKIELILRELLTLQKPGLLVIDNANDFDDLNNIYPALRKCSSLHLLITTRVTKCSHAEMYPVNCLNEKNAKKLFVSHYAEHNPSDDNILNLVMEAVGYNTLVIELLAKNLNNFNNELNKQYSLNELLGDLRQKGLLNLSMSENVDTDYKLQKAKPEKIIEAMYDISVLDEDEKAILSLFSVLPPQNIPFKNISSLLNHSDGLDKLMLSIAHKGWIYFDKGIKSFKCSPVIQEIIRRQNGERLEADCRELINNLVSKLDYEPGTGNVTNVSYDEAATLVQYGESVCGHLFPVRGDFSILLDRIGNFYKTYGNLDKALKFFEDNLKLTKELHETFPDNMDYKNGLAVSYGKLGEAHTSLGNLDKALKFFEDFLKLTKKLNETFPNNVVFKNGLATSYGKLGSTHTSLGNLDEALKLFEDARALFEELHETFHNHVDFKNGLAISYSKLGETHTSLGNLDKALKFFEDYHKLTKEIHETFPANVGFKNGLAVSYEKLGSTHTSLGNLDKALKFFEERSRLGRELHETFPNNVKFKNGLAVSYEKLGSTHTSLGNLDKALKFFEDETTLFEKLHETYPDNVEFKNGLAVSYAELGSTYTSLGNLDKALKFFGDFLKLTKLLYETFPDNVEFTNELAISYEKLGETHTSMGNLDKALQFFEDDLKLTKELYETYPDNVGFKNGLAVSYSKLGSTHTSLGNLDKALQFFEDETTLFEELHETYPDNVGFKNGLAVSYSKLGDTHTSLGNLDKALQFFEDETTLFEELHETYPNNVEFKNGLAVSYAKLGVFFRDSKKDKPKARKYFIKAKDLWEFLVKKFPAYIEFQKNLDWVINVLNEL